MDRERLDWPIFTAIDTRTRIDPKPQYQRTPVWKEAKKQLLIDSILRNYDLPKLYLREVTGRRRYRYEVVDGQQRLRSIWEFSQNKFALGLCSGNLPGCGDLSGKRYRQLPEEVRQRFNSYALTIITITRAGEEEVRDLFLRLQEGVALNPAEKRNAMIGGMRDFIADIATTHDLFKLTHIPGDRFAWHDLTAICTALEIAGGPCDVKAPDLKHLYDSKKNFDPNGAVARRLRSNLTWMKRILRKHTPEMNIKWGFVDLYLLVSRLSREYDIKGVARELRRFYVEFEQRRRDVTDESALARGDKWDHDLFAYISAFEKAGGTKRNIDQRHGVYMRAVLKHLPRLGPRDRTRAFTEDERIVIWRRADEKCQECGEQIPFAKMEADHIRPHARGGATSLANAQALCRKCNRRKAARQCRAQRVPRRAA